MALEVERITERPLSQSALPEFRPDLPVQITVQEAGQKILDLNLISLTQESKK